MEYGRELLYVAGGGGVDLKEGDKSREQLGEKELK